ncbi:MAG: methyltransferase [Moorea sp. SIO4G3]|nr:methyltransferase [Moorena sp. SIO4G3]
MSGILDVQGKRVLDLGCGAGLIGFCCILKQSQKVLFSDLHPNIGEIKNHPLMPSQDQVKVQDLCAGEAEETYDTIFMPFPSRSIDAVGETFLNTLKALIFRLMIEKHFIVL